MYNTSHKLYFAGLTIASFISVYFIGYQMVAINVLMGAEITD
jgi:hypothetical protein